MNSKAFSSTIKIRLCLQFMTTMASMSVTPFLVIYFSTLLGIFTTGFMFLGVMLASVGGSFLGGYLSDRKGRKKVIVFAEAFVFIGFLVAALANSPWASLPYLTFIIFVVIHFSTGMAGPAYQALLIDESNPENRRVIYTFSYWLNNLAIAIGGIVGAFLFLDYHFYLFSGVSILTLISLFITCIWIKDNYKVKQEITSVKDIPKSSYKETLKNRSFLGLAVANLLLISVEEQLTNYIGIRLINEMTEPKNLFPFLSLKVDGINMIGLLKTENTIVVVCLTVLITYLFKRFKDRPILFSGLFLYFIGYIVISFSNVPSFLLIAMFIASLGELMHIPIKMTLLANMVPDHARSTYMAVYGLSSIIGASLAGVVLLISSVVPAYMISCLFVIAGTVSMIIFYRITLDKSSSSYQHTVNASVTG